MELFGKRKSRTWLGVGLGVALANGRQDAP